MKTFTAEIGHNVQKSIYLIHTWDLNGLCCLFFSVFAIIFTPVFLPSRRVGGGAVTSRRPAEGTQWWLQDGLSGDKYTRWKINTLLTLNASCEETASDFFAGLCHDLWNESDPCLFAFALWNLNGNAVGLVQKRKLHQTSVHVHVKKSHNFFMFIEFTL